MKNDISYFSKREHKATKQSNKRIEKASQSVNRVLLEQQKVIEQMINDLYMKYSNAEKLSYAEAQKAVNAFDIKKYEQKAEEYVKNKDFSSTANYQLRLYNAKMQISRLELLLNEIHIEIAKGYDLTKSIMQQALSDEIKQEILRQAGILNLSVSDIDSAMKRFLETSHRGAKFADFWGKDIANLYNELDTTIKNALMNGENPKKLIGKVKRMFDVTKYQAKRLLLTETTFSQTRVQLAAFKAAGFTHFRLVVESGACDTCSAYRGKSYSIDEWMNLGALPPIHPNCRCTLIPDYEGFEDRYLDDYKG
ncbi:minor capsid protein [Vagococcus carniphilus]|uniref:minor capsid protein n=1 Tax=Vagococcus carniphilus TaxID=218144 RepID=UPI0028925C5C|nr:minor capsid protein [Vagococcus carniphilus]MDT2830031.1 minor capsid protein [Vagococcus carniphilus]MDT2855627.1 minor capsid protein [Vagococcus carniphilus]